MSDRNDEATVPAWFAALYGRWRLRRCVLAWAAPNAHDDTSVVTAAASHPASRPASPHVEARLVGEVTLMPAEFETALHYEETGTLRLRHGTSLQSKRRYLYRFEDTASRQQLAIDFADGPSSGLPFVRLPWPALSERDAEKGDDLHLCGDDRYRVRYRFETARDKTAAHGEAALSCEVSEADSKRPLHPGMEAVAWRLIKQRRDEAVRREDDIDLLLWHRIVQRTRVRGPKKDYAIVSILDRIE